MVLPAYFVNLLLFFCVQGMSILLKLSAISDQVHHGHRHIRIKAHYLLLVNAWTISFF